MSRNKSLLIAGAVFLAFLYCLNRGIYVGSAVTGDDVYTKSCHYLFISGISSVAVGVGTTPEQASTESRGCSILDH